MNIDIIYFIAILMASISVLWNYIIQPNQILGKVGDWIFGLPEWIGKPLGACIFCQNFWFSLAFSIAVCFWEHNAIYLAITPISFTFTIIINKIQQL